LNKKNLPALVGIVIALVVVSAAIIFWPGPKESVYVKFNEKWEIGSDQMSIAQVHNPMCMFCSGQSLEPSINFYDDGKNYTTSRNISDRIFVQPNFVSMSDILAGIGKDADTYQRFFVGNKINAFTPNGKVIAMYAKVDRVNVSYAVEEVYDPGWAYDPVLRSIDAEKSIAEHHLNGLSMMFYLLGFLAFSVTSSYGGYWFVKKRLQDR